MVLIYERTAWRNREQRPSTHLRHSATKFAIMHKQHRPECDSLSLPGFRAGGEAHEATEIHRTSRRCGGMAAGGARAAAGKIAPRRRVGIRLAAPPARGCPPAWAAKLWLFGRPEYRA